jgi:hypothetical protein
MERSDGRDIVLLHDSPTTAARRPRRPQLGEVVVVGLDQGQRRELRRLREEVRDLRDEGVSKQIRLDAWCAAYAALGRRLRRARVALEIAAVVALAGWLLAAALLWIALGLG